MENLKKENNHLQVEIHQRHEREAELKRIIKNLEGRIQEFEEENNVIRTYNEQFGSENDGLMAENNKLKAELAQYRQIRVPQNLLQQELSDYASVQRLSTDRLITSDKTNAAKARVKILLIFYNILLI